MCLLVVIDQTLAIMTVNVLLINNCIHTSVLQPYGPVNCTNNILDFGLSYWGEGPLFFQQMDGVPRMPQYSMHV